MDAIEFVSNYSKYLNEIKSVIRLELMPVINELESKEPVDLIPAGKCFTSENDARGYVWNLFVDGTNRYAYQTITIDIDDIKSIKDVEMFFILLEKERISYHPESSFHDIINTDLNRNVTGSTFTAEESDRLEMLMKKCIDLTDELNIDLYEISKRANLIIRGKNDWNQSPPEEY